MMRAKQKAHPVIFDTYPIRQGNPMNISTQRVVIVRGPSRGIGAAIATRLARDNHAIVVNYARYATAAEQVVSEIEAGGAWVNGQVLRANGGMV